LSRRVLHLIPTLRGGGAEYQLSLLAAELPRAGWDVSVGYVHDGVHAATIGRTSARLHRLPTRGNYDPSLLWQIASLVRHAQPAIVQTWLPQMDVIGGLVSRILGVPWVVAERSSKPVIGRRFVGEVRERITHHATAVISNSTHALAHWELRHPGVRRFHVANAIPLASADLAPPSEEIQGLRERESCAVAVGIGRLVPLKRFDVFLRAVKIVNASAPTCAVICGEGPELEPLRKIAAEAGIAGRVTFTGFVTEVLPYIKAADLVVALSEYEGRPNAVVEAMAARTPLVVSDIPEHRELLGPNALYVRGDDPQEVADALLAVIRDRKGAAARSEAARVQAEVWDSPNIAARYAEVYELLTGRAGGAA